MRKYIFFLSLLLLLLAACSGQSDKETRPVVTFAYQDRVADAASIIAVEKGFFSAEGLQVKPLVFSSGPACTEALTDGNAHFGTMGDCTAIITASRGDGFNILVSHGGGEHRHRIIVAVNGPIKKIADLEGKRIGVKKGTSTHGGLELFARRNHLNMKDELLDITPQDQLLALISGELDAIVSSEPTPSKAEADGRGRELATLGNLGNNYPVFLLGNGIFADEHPDIPVKMVRALARAGSFIRRFPDETAAILAEQSGMSQAVIRRAMSHHQYDLRLDDGIMQSLEGTAQFLLETGKIKQIPDWPKVIDQEPLRQAGLAKRKD